MPRFLTLLACCFLLCSAPAAYAKVSPELYGVRIDAPAQKAYTARLFDSTLKRTLQLAPEKKVSNFIARPHVTENNTLDFYLLLALCALLGAIKTIHPKYFNDLWRAFLNPTLGNRQLKDIIQAATFPNLLMNVYSCTVLGVYAFYLISVNVDWRFVGVPSGLVVCLMMMGALLTYTGKYMFVQFTGWAFNIRHTAELYNFNIFLVNKISGMVLLPFVVCFAFLNARWDTSICILSVLLLVILLFNRYVRSWNIFAQFFQNSRFHFFMYLCAFEILPLAVLLKLVLRIL